MINDILEVIRDKYNQVGFVGAICFLAFLYWNFKFTLRKYQRTKIPKDKKHLNIKLVKNWISNSPEDWKSNFLWTKKSGKNYIVSILVLVLGGFAVWDFFTKEHFMMLLYIALVLLNLLLLLIRWHLLPERMIVTEAGIHTSKGFIPFYNIWEIKYVKEDDEFQLTHVKKNEGGVIPEIKQFNVGLEDPQDIYKLIIFMSELEIFNHSIKNEVKDYKDNENFRVEVPYYFRDRSMFFNVRTSFVFGREDF